MQYAFAQGIYAALVVGGAALASRFGISLVAVSTALALLVFYAVLSVVALGCCEMKIRPFLLLHLRPFAISCVAGTAAWASSVLLAEKLDSALIRLLFSGTIGLLACLFIIMISPRTILGPSILSTVLRVRRSPQTTSGTPK